MSDYQKMVADEAQRFFDEVWPLFQKDSGEHGGASQGANLSKWLDQNRKLLDHVDEISKGWGRADALAVNQSSRNAVAYGDPRESAYFALHKDLLQELRKLRKAAEAQ